MTMKIFLSWACIWQRYSSLYVPTQAFPLIVFSNLHLNASCNALLRKRGLFSFYYDLITAAAVDTDASKKGFPWRSVFGAITIVPSFTHVYIRKVLF